MTEHDEAVDLAKRVLVEGYTGDGRAWMLARQFLLVVEELTMLRARDGALETADKFIAAGAKREGQMIAEIEQLRAALLPYGDAARKPRRLLNPVDGEPLPDEYMLALPAPVSAWRRSAELTGGAAAGSPGQLTYSIVGYPPT